MSQQKLNAAILGLNEEGLDLLAAVEKSGLFEIEAVAESDVEIAEEIAKRYDCQAFTDYRQLIVRSKVDVLLAAAPIHLCDEHIRSALKENIHVLKLCPGGLNFENTAELIRMGRKSEASYSIAVTERFSPGFTQLREYMKEQESVGKFNLITASCFVPQEIEKTQDRWLWDPMLAGGGVLLRRCYGIIDQIVSYFGLPQQVYSLNSNHAPDKQQRLSITEDTAIVTMKFSDTLFANIVASRILGPTTQTLRLHSIYGNVTTTENSMTVCENNGEKLQEYNFESSRINSMQKMLESYADEIISLDEEIDKPEAGNALNVAAVIESAYLSARTSLPEEPARLLSLVK